METRPEIIRLDGAAMTDRAAAHRELKTKLSFPDYYGGNLDALWDMLTGISAEVVLQNAAAMKDSLGHYGEKLLETLSEAAEKNPNFRFRAEE